MTNVISEGNLILTVLFDPSMAYQCYDATHYRYQETNRRVATAPGAVRILVPPSLRPLVRRTVHALLDEANRRAFAFAEPPVWVAALTTGTLRLRAGPSTIWVRLGSAARPRPSHSLTKRTRSVSVD